MGKIEEDLKDLIINKYGSINQFAKNIGMPYSTIGNILRRGVSNSSIFNIFKICKALNISTDGLALGKLVEPKNKLKKEIAKHLMFFREQKGLSQEELAKKIEINPLLLDDWEKNSRNIDVDTLYEICNVLDVSMTDMFGEFASQSTNNFSAEEKKNVLKVRRLNSEGKKYIVRQIEYALQQDDFLFKTQNFFETRPTYNVEEKEY